MKKGINDQGISRVVKTTFNVDNKMGVQTITESSGDIH